MSDGPPRIDALPPDHRAVLSLILRRGRSYADIAVALELDEEAVRDRAHAAAAELAPKQAAGLQAPLRGQIADYILGQQSTATRLVTLDEIEGSPPAAAYAQVLADQLRGFSDTALPELPRDGAPPAPASPPPASPPKSSPPKSSPRPASPPPTSPPPTSSSPPTSSPPTSPRPPKSPPPQAIGGPRSSRRGGAVLLAAIVVAVVVVIVLVTGSGSQKATPAAATGTTGAASSTQTKSTTTEQVHLVEAVKLAAPHGGGAVGEAAILSEGGRYVVALDAEKLPPSNGFFYAAWLYNSPTDAFALGKAPQVGAKGRLKPVAQALPANASSFHRLIVTRETSDSPTAPGETVLSGSFSLR